MFLKSLMRYAIANASYKRLLMKVEKIIGDLWDRRLACPRTRTGETPIPQELPDLIFNFH